MVKHPWPQPQHLQIDSESKDNEENSLDKPDATNKNPTQENIDEPSTSDDESTPGSLDTDADDMQANAHNVQKNIRLETLALNVEVSVSYRPETVSPAHRLSKKSTYSLKFRTMVYTPQQNRLLLVTMPITVEMEVTPLPTITSLRQPMIYSKPQVFQQDHVMHDK